MTFGHLTHTLSSNTLWDVRVGRFVYRPRTTRPAPAIATTPNQFDRVTGVTERRAAPDRRADAHPHDTSRRRSLTIRPALFGADHEWKVGTQVERGEHYGPTVIPGGVRYRRQQRATVSSGLRAPSNAGGQFITAARSRATP